MSLIPQSKPAPSLSAHIEERILAPLRRNTRATRWFTVTLALMLGLHGAILAALLYRDRSAPPAAPQETPVEVVVEPPKPPPAPKVAEKKPEPPPQPKQEIEKPATSAPREANDTKIETPQMQKETHAPKAPEPPTDGEKTPEKEASSPSSEPAEPNKTEEAAKPDVLKKDAEIIKQAAEKPKEKPKKVAKLTPKAKVRRQKTAMQHLAGASALPDYSFARPTKKSPVTGGNEDSRYLAIVYGMIMRHRDRIDIPGDMPGNVTIAFEVDDEGNVIGMGVQHTSGYPEVDAAAAAAIRRASPFPPPPAGSPHGLVATIVYGDS